VILNHANTRNEKLRRAQASLLLRARDAPVHDATMAKRPISQAAKGFPDRLRTVREGAGFKEASAFARALGVEPPAYRKWERGDSEPALAHLALIQDITRCSLDWLITGKVPAFVPFARAS
jgi:DNA-binding transcriptional regulator YiaG